MARRGDSLCDSLRCTPLAPFGLLVEAPDIGADLTKLSATMLAEWTTDARLLVLRGFSVLDLADYSSLWGQLLLWDFGPVLNLEVHQQPRNYLFTRGEVPFHWDGAFAAVTPSYIFFQCIEAAEQGEGGETLFSDTTQVFQQATPERRHSWEQIRITYNTEKVEHYGGRVTHPLVSVHPRSRLTTLRYAEPLDSEAFLNPLFLEIAGLSTERETDFIADMKARLYRPEVCYAHAWRKGDIVIADNHALVHGRRSLTSDSQRRLQRVHVI
ncbi:MAG: TauD/TfdA family dioxygenase [Actinomycetota bacterium]|nr:TauD/TfdA family dioxygenase [Actinomycetota bacterium]